VNRNRLTIRFHLPFAKHIPYGKAYSDISATVNKIRDQLTGKIRVHRVWPGVDIEGFPEDITAILFAHDANNKA